MNHCTNYEVYLYAGISDGVSMNYCTNYEATFMLVYLMSVNELLH